MGKSCGTCIYYREITPGVWGECHKAAPIARVVDFDPDRIPWAIWPAVGPNDWCAEYYKAPYR